MQYLSCIIHRFGLALHLEGLLDVLQNILQMQRKTETDGENESWITEQARTDDDDDIIAMYRVVWGKPNHLLVHMISSNFRCVFSTSKLATIGRQMSVMIGNEANRTKHNIKRTIHI